METILFFDLKYDILNQMKLQTVAFYTITILLFTRIYKMDTYDRTHPYGLDITRNVSKKDLIGEDYGKDVYWGKPEYKDTIKKRLDKIEWLGKAFRTEVSWRRAMIGAFILSTLLIFVIDYKLFTNYNIYISFVMISFIVLYFQTQYYKHHLCERRGRFITTHVNKIKTKLKLPIINTIYDEDI